MTGMEENNLCVDPLDISSREEKKSETVEEETLTTKVLDEDGEDNNDEEQQWIDDFQHLSIDDYLDSDPVDNHGDASFTGVWNAAKGMIQYLQQKTTTARKGGAGAEEGGPPPKYILELGAGTGWLGITIARNDRYDTIRHVVLTDNSQTGAVQWTQSNVNAALSQGLFLRQDKVMVNAMDWNDQEQVKQVASKYPFDLVLGSDLIYSEDRIQPLAETIATLLEILTTTTTSPRNNNNNNNQQPQDDEEETHQTSPSAGGGGGGVRFLYGHTQGRMPEMDLLWEKELNAHGLKWKILETFPQWDDRKTVIMEISRRRLL